MDDQENDTRASVGTIYWEGAVSAYKGDNLVGRGYLELTGYWKPMKL
jgi:predicted secreted hydrolase